MTYTLTVAGAPDGYTYTADMTFTIDENGNVKDEKVNFVNDRGTVIGVSWASNMIVYQNIISIIISRYK